jgi:hypothetical protein
MFCECLAKFMVSVGRRDEIEKRNVSGKERRDKTWSAR